MTTQIHEHYHADRSVPDWLSLPFRAFASIGVAVLYLVVLVLMKIAPDRSAMDLAAVAARHPNGRGSRAIRWSVYLYRSSLISRHFKRAGGRCMFLPSCSEFALRAAEKYGLFHGLMVIGDRFRRCRADTCEDYVDFP